MILRNSAGQVRSAACLAIPRETSSGKSFPLCRILKPYYYRLSATHCIHVSTVSSNLSILTADQHNPLSARDHTIDISQPKKKLHVYKTPKLWYAYHTRKTITVYLLRSPGASGMSWLGYRVSNRRVEKGIWGLNFVHVFLFFIFFYFYYYYFYLLGPDFINIRGN
ncbi:hypothetical protein BDZ91DRAFT_539380 [Kalaharituber pfeilii]|nr:hypothetical protein BDZ91DRAFT_539380 [Kalaharituber pfeilii]